VTGIDRAEGALAVARQRARDQGVRITPILQSAEEFDWGCERWDLVAFALLQRRPREHGEDP